MLARLSSSLLLFAFPLTVVAVERALTFEQDVRPILKAHCTNCHGEEEKPKGGVDLRLRRFMDKQTDSGLRVVARPGGMVGAPNPADL